MFCPTVGLHLGSALMPVLVLAISCHLCHNPFIHGLILLVLPETPLGAPLLSEVVDQGLCSPPIGGAFNEPGHSMMQVICMESGCSKATVKKPSF